MSKRTIGIGTTANDGTGDPLRTILQDINAMNTELYELRNKVIDLSSFTISDDDDLYAHESQTIITKINNKVFLLVIYMSNKVSHLEWQTTAHAILKVYELTTKTFIAKFDLFYPGLIAGVTMPVDEEINVPRMYVTGTTLRCYCPNTSTLFTRDINISDDDPTGWTPGNISIAQMTMKDAGGNNVLADVTSANINIHLDYVLGDNAANYHDLMPLFRNLDMPAKNGANWYATLEFSSERSHSLARPTICVISADSGLSWTFGGLIGYTTSARNQCVETTITFIGSVLHVFERGNTHYVSSDAGLTWTASNAISLVNNSSKPCAINFTPSGLTQLTLLALTLTSEVVGTTARTTLGIYTTADFITFTEVYKIVTRSYAHYPSLCWYQNSLYASYTKSLKGATDRDSIVMAKIW